MLSLVAVLALGQTAAPDALVRSLDRAAEAARLREEIRELRAEFQEADVGSAIIKFVIGASLVVAGGLLFGIGAQQDNALAFVGAGIGVPGFILALIGGVQWGKRSAIRGSNPSIIERDEAQLRTLGIEP